MSMSDVCRLVLRGYILYITMNRKDEERLLGWYNELSSDDEHGIESSGDESEIPSSPTDPFADSDNMTDDPTYIQENDSSSITESDNNQDDENAEILEGEHFIIPEVTLENNGLDEVEGAEWARNTIEIPNFSFNQNESGIKVDISVTSIPMDVFSKTWSSEVEELILGSTNRYGNDLVSKNRPKHRGSRSKIFHDLDLDELRIFIGLCFLGGQIKFPTLRKMFTLDPLYYHPTFSSKMSGRRFEEILRAFSCELLTDSDDALRKITPLMRLILDNSQSAMYPYEQLSLDESLLLFRGRLRFRQYIKGKKAKYGIKLYELCTPDGYVLNIEIYKGKQMITENPSKSKLEDLVLRLMQPYLDKGHHLFMDNFYNSIRMSNTLLSRKTHSTGTLRPNRKGVCKEMVREKLKKGQHIWKRQNNIYISKWKDKRDVYSITTGYHPDLVTVSNRYGKERIKPLQISEYNKYMSGVDRCDQMIAYYSSPRKTVRWYKKVKFHLLDIAVWNSFYIYKQKVDKKIDFIKFRDSLIRSLIGVPQDEKNGRSYAKPPRRHFFPPPVEKRNHYQEKIPHPPNFKRKTYFLRCVQCRKNKLQKATSWRCRDCESKVPLCPGKCFEAWHKE